jgi:hypothetical protein
MSIINQTPIDISAIYLDNTSATISFYTASGSIVNPYYYFHVVVFDASGTINDASGYSSPITVYGLTKGTAYSCYVDLVQYAATTTVTVKTMQWPKIYTFVLSGITYSSITPQWSGLDISSITIMRAVGAGATAASVYASTYVTSYRDTDISGNTFYSYYAIPYLYDKTGTASATVSTTTPSAPPTAAAAVSYDCSSVTVSFTEAKNSYTTEYYYILRPTINGTTAGHDASGVSSPIIATNLSGNTTFSLWVISAIDNSINLYATSASGVYITTLTRPPVNLNTVYTDCSVIGVSFSPGSNTYSSIYYTISAGVVGIAGSGGTATLQYIVGLSGNTQYTISVTNRLNGNVALTATAVCAPVTTLTQPASTLSQYAVDSSSITVAFVAGRNTGSTVYTAIGTDVCGAVFTATSATAVPICVSCLSGNTKFTFVVNTTLNGNSALSATSTTTALAARTYVQAPQNVTLTTFDSSSATITFTEAANSYATSSYYLATFSAIGTPITTVSGTTNVLQMTGLSASTEYTFYVKSVVTGRSSTIGTVSTYNPYPTISGGSVVLYTVSYNTISVGWTGTEISFVQVWRAAGAEGAATDISAVALVSPYRDYDISGNTTYSYYITPIRIYNGVTKTGAVSDTVTGKTPIAPPQNVSAGYYDFSAIVLTFTEPRNTYSIGYVYTAYATDASGVIYTASGQTTPLILTNLNQLTTYTCYVKVVLDNSAALTVTSNIISITTKQHYAQIHDTIFFMVRYT